MNAVKLVIWDLDETFWQGTLSEEGIRWSQENHALVRSLADRGIVSAICSKNDHAAVRRVLDEHEAWDDFVFAKIEWMPKGQLIADIIRQMNLRAPNVLFIDDNPQNRAEAQYCAPGLQVADPQCLPALLDQPALAGKPDPGRQRLAQYKLLESKLLDQQQFGAVGNNGFLHQCQIQVEVDQQCLPQLDRLAEMIERTNQLNFTKQRLTADDLRKTLADPQIESGYVRVRDRYGDYGIVGFYALRNGELVHYLFSCRILNMGVEAWLYDRLGRPRLSVVGEVAGDPFLLPVPDWINSPKSGEPTASVTVATSSSWPRTLLKGGCDLEQILDFLGDRRAFQGEFNFASRKHRAPVHTEHTEMLRQVGCGRPEQFGELIDRIPFLEPKAFASAVFQPEFEVVVYSTLMDLTQAVYRYLHGDFTVTWGDFLYPLTDESHWDELCRNRPYLDRDFLTWFRTNFEFCGGLTEEKLIDNLRWLCRSLPARQFIILNGAEVALPHPIETDRHQHHRRMNAAIEQAIAPFSHAEICDVRKFVTSAKDVTDNIRHYRREVHFQIAEELRRLIAARWSLQSSRFDDWARKSKLLAVEVYRSARRGLHRLIS